MTISKYSQVNDIYKYIVKVKMQRCLKNILTAIHNYIQLCMVGTIQFSKLLCVHTPKEMLYGGQGAKNSLHLKINSLNRQIFSLSIVHNYLQFCTSITKKHHTILSTMYTIQCIQCIQLCSMVFVGGEQ